MRYTLGFVNRRSRVQISKAAQCLPGVLWPTVAHTPGHGQVRDPSSTQIPPDRESDDDVMAPYRRWGCP